jgi:hypothetical protein
MLCCLPQFPATIIFRILLSVSRSKPYFSFPAVDTQLTSGVDWDDESVHTSARSRISSYIDSFYPSEDNLNEISVK